MTDPRATAAAARIHERAPDLADEPTERLVRDYLDAAEPHDLATLSADDVAGAVIAILRLGRDRPPGGRVVAVANPSAARDGWDSPHTAVDVVTDDAPFLVDSVSAALVRRGYDLHLLLHPLLEHPGVGTTSHLHVEIDRETDPVVLAALDLEVRSVVDDVFAAVEDWDAMRERVAELARGLEERPPPHADPADVAEVATYLAWLADDHFTFVAAAEVDVDGDVVPGSELGVARAARAVPRARTRRPHRRLAAVAHQVVATLHRPPRRAPRRGRHPPLRA